MPFDEDKYKIAASRAEKSRADSSKMSTFPSDQPKLKVIPIPVAHETSSRFKTGENQSANGNKVSLFHPGEQRRCGNEQVE